MKTKNNKTKKRNKETLKNTEKQKPISREKDGSRARELTGHVEDTGPALHTEAHAQKRALRVTSRSQVTRFIGFEIDFKNWRRMPGLPFSARHTRKGRDPRDQCEP